jgi:hypothetical protein
MPATIQALAIGFFAILPGALYVWGLERHVGKWGLGSPDRFLRFLAASAVFHVLFAPTTFWLWKRYVESATWNSGTDFPRGLWLALTVYLVVPYLVGNVVGVGAAGGAWTPRSLFSRDADPPRAWDFFFARRPDGWIRLKLKSGTWIGGAYARGSYAAGYPEDGDLLLANRADVDAVTGDFLIDAGGRVVLRGEKLLIRWEEVEYLEFIDG